MDEREFIDSNGYLVVRDLLDQDEIAVLQQKFDETRFEENLIHQYDQWAGKHPEDLLQVLVKPKNLNRLKALTGTNLMWAQMQAFRLLSGNEAHKLNWHFGRESYLYLMPEFSGWTLWIPLTPIEPDKQRGGMAFLSKRLADGGCEAHLLSALAGRNDWRKLGPHFITLSRNFIDNPLLDAMRDEPAFKVGDAVLIHKFTYHTSITLNAGPLQQRNAIALRFVDEAGLLNKYAAERLGPFLANKMMSSILAKYEHGAELRQIDQMFRILRS